MIYDLSNTENAYRANRYLHKLKHNGRRIKLEIYEPKSSAQRRYLHLILGWFGTHKGNTLEEIKQGLFKQVINKDIFVIEKEIDGNIFIIIRSSEDLTTKEYSLSIARFRHYALIEHNISLPAPNEHKRLNWIEQELYKVKEFL